MSLTAHISWDSLISFMAVCFLIESTPGPNMAFLTLVSATKGRRLGFATVLGVTLGLLIIGFAAAAGLATLISNSPLLYNILRYGGVGYLLWLAWTEWRGEPSDIQSKPEALEDWRAYFQHGLIVNLLNPKAGIFYITVLPSFIDSQKVIVIQAVSLTLIYVAIATIMHLLIVSLAGFIRPVLKSPNRKQIIKRILAAMLAAIAIWLGATT